MGGPEIHCSEHGNRCGWPFQSWLTIKAAQRCSVNGCAERTRWYGRRERTGLRGCWLPDPHALPRRCAGGGSTGSPPRTPLSSPPAPPPVPPPTVTDRARARPHAAVGSGPGKTGGIVECEMRERTCPRANGERVLYKLPRHRTTDLLSRSSDITSLINIILTGSRAPGSRWPCRGPPFAP